MPPRTTATFAKRQKEQARREKQMAKQQRRLERRQDKRESPPDSESGALGPNPEIASHADPLSPTTTAAPESAPTQKEQS